MEPPNNRAGYIMQWINYVEDAFILDEEKSKKNLLASNKEAKPIAGILFHLQLLYKHLTL